MKNFASITTLYVSNAIGYDDNSGIHYENTAHGDGPVKTLTRAIKFVSAMRCSGYNQPVTIKIMDEEYTLDAPIDIRQFDDSYLFKGNNKVLDLTIESFDNNKKTLISGGRRLTGFKPDKFNGIDCLSVEIPEVKEEVVEEIPVVEEEVVEEQIQEEVAIEEPTQVEEPVSEEVQEEVVEEEPAVQEISLENLSPLERYRLQKKQERDRLEKERQALIESGNLTEENDPLKKYRVAKANRSEARVPTLKEQEILKQASIIQQKQNRSRKR